MHRLKRFSLAPVWIALASTLLSLAWLSPNHSKPWTSFHSDAWMATMLAAMGLVVILRAQQRVKWQGLVLVVALMVLVPFAQYAFGLLPFAGQAWIASVYILGFLLALLVGQQWQLWKPVWMGDTLFLAIGTASIVSVALQFQQWLEPGGNGTLDVWAVGSDGSRPYANMAQVNQLATLLLWGLVACAWGVWRRQLGRSAALLASVFLLTGLALTQSRTAAVGLAAFVLASWWWRRAWGAKNVPVYVTGLGAIYVLMLWMLGPIRQLLMLEVPVSMVQRLGYELRPELWRMLSEAVLQRPWTGYGWNQVVPAQAALAERYLPLRHPFFQSHNLFLDFTVWVGIPLGLFLACTVVAWLVTAFMRVRRPEQALYLLMILAVGIHAMLELPLHYGYFLLPTGLALGALNADLNIWPIAQSSRFTGRWALLTAWCLGAVLLGMVVRDYFHVEESYNALQLEKAHIQNSRPAEPPEVLLLTDLREIQRFMKYEPAGGASMRELQWAREVTLLWPSPRSFMTLAVLLGLNNQPVEASQWLIKMCRIVPREQCEAGPIRWEQAQKLHPELLGIRWPVATTSAPGSGSPDLK